MHGLILTQIARKNERRDRGDESGGLVVKHLRHGIEDGEEEEKEKILICLGVIYYVDYILKWVPRPSRRMGMLPLTGWAEFPLTP